MGKVVSDGSFGTIHSLVSPIYNITLGVNPALISTIVFVQRLWDAMLDPVCGHFSDNFRSRWGRRLPLIFAASPVLALLFAGLWFFPREASTTYLFWHLLIVSLVFFVAHSVYAMALGGLILEATDDYHERTRIASLTLAFAFAFLVGSQWLFPATQLPIFGDTITGLRWVAGACAVAFFLAGLFPVWLCRERHYKRIAARQERQSLWENLKTVRGNRQLFAIVSARFTVSFGYQVVGVFFLYMNNYYVFGGDIKKAVIALGVVGSTFQFTAIISSLFIFPPMVRRWGKKRAFQIAAVILMFGCISKLFVYQPGMPWLQLIVLVSNGMSNAGMMLAVNAMLGDLADYDELRTGLRREGLFMSLMNWADKAGNSLGSLLTGFLLVAIGFDAKLGAQSSSTLELMKYFYFFAPFAGAVAGLWFIRNYDLDAKRVEENRLELERRHASA